MKTEKIYCADCGKETKLQGCSTGYGVDNKNRKICFECCAKNDLQSMIETGHSKNLPLYLTLNNESNSKAIISNWPGTLKFNAIKYSIGRHNIAGKRYDVWFRVPQDNNSLWHGVQYGEYTQIAHCKRIKG